MTGEFSFTIETWGGFSDKVPHLCPFHQERNPSAVTFLKSNGRCFTYCSACGQKAWGQYEILGNTIVVRTKRWRERVANPAPPSASVSSCRKEEAESKAAWYKIIKSRVPPLEKPSQEVLEFWEEYLRVKGVDTASLDQIEVVPVIFDFGIWFPVSVVDALGNITRTTHFGVVRSIPYKSLNFFPDLSPSACAYIPCPSSLDDYNFVAVVESPISALRIAQTGWKNAVAALGTNKKVLNNIRNRYKTVVIHDPGKGEQGIISDIDKLTNERIAALMQMIAQQ